MNEKKKLDTDLEHELKQLYNKYEIVDKEGDKVIYEGWLYDFNLHNNATIYGNGIIKKSVEKVVQVKRIIKREPEFETKTKVLWEQRNNSGGSSSREKLISSEGLKKNLPTYRTDLISQLYDSEKILLDKELMDNIFNPIEKRLEEIYNKVFGGK